MSIRSHHHKILIKISLIHIDHLKAEHDWIMNWSFEHLPVVLQEKNMTNICLLFKKYPPICLLFKRKNIHPSACCLKNIHPSACCSKGKISGICLLFKRKNIQHLLAVQKEKYPASACYSKAEHYKPACYSEEKALNLVFG